MKVYFILTKMNSRSGVVFSPTQVSQGLVRRTDFNGGVLQTSEKRERVCGGGGGEGRVIGKSTSLPSSPLSLMINSNILKKVARVTGDKEERPDNDDDDDDNRYGHNDHDDDYNYDCLCNEDYDKDDNDDNDNVRMMTTTTTIMIMKVMLINMLEGAKRICFCRCTVKFLKIDRNIEALFIVKFTILATNREVDP